MTEPPGVRERLQQQFGLKVLRISMDTADGSSHVVFSISVESEKEAALLTAKAEELGLPASSDFATDGGMDLQESSFRLPEYILSALKNVVSESEPEDAALWLRLSSPIGLVAAIPWERLLQPALGVPVLRLPYHLIKPNAARTELDSVVCFSSPAGAPEVNRGLIDQFVSQIPADLAKHTTFHLFADRDVWPKLCEVRKEYGDEFRIQVYDPASQREALASKGQNPWLSWIRRALGKRCADMVHFFCHCYRVRDEGALALAVSPWRDQSDGAASPVFAPELAEFLNQTGAWSVAFTSPPSNRSSAGLRMLQDAVARLRPGPVLLHDLAHPDSGHALEAAYRYIYLPGQPPPASPAMSLYCHPFRGAGDQPDDESNRLLHEYTLAGRLGDRLSGSSQPAWLAASQRVLESSAAGLAAAAEADPESGRKRGRQFVLEALADYAASGAADEDPADSE